MKTILSGNEKEEPLSYEPTLNEEIMLKDAIKDKLKEYYDCTPKEFCEMEKGMGMSQ